MVMTLIGFLLAKVAKDRKSVLAAGVVIFVAVLGFFKYTGFVEKTINSLTGAGLTVMKIALPLGISFYTFKLISYLADVYKGRIEAERNYGRLLLYTMTFHHVMQGPIIRYGDLAPQLDHRTLTKKEFAEGLHRFILGLGKKVILADYCGQQAAVLIPTTKVLSAQPTAGLWLGSAIFTMQMYLDFSAYCDMAIGLGRMCGFTYIENFNYPYTAISISGYWRRWHISLSQFFRDYIYIPMGGSRVNAFREFINLLVVWFLTGLWHGASWNFILWGLFFFVFIGIEHIFRKKVKAPGHIRKFFGHIYVLLVVDLSFVLFRFTDLGQLGTVLKLMFAGKTMVNEQFIFSVKNNLFFIIVSVLACTPLIKIISDKMTKTAENSAGGSFTVTVIRSVYTSVIFVWALVAMAGSTYTPFLYNQF